MKLQWKVVVVVVLAAAISATVVMKYLEGRPADVAPSADEKEEPVGEDHGPLPKLVELGGSKCTPCVAMKPVLEELEREYAGQLEVEAIDATVDAAAQDLYNEWTIPTQVFLDEAGNKLDSHPGFMSKEDILDRWALLGYVFEEPRNLSTSAPAETSRSLFQIVFSTMERIFKRGALFAVAAAFIWGICSVVLSPCHLASIPLIIGFIDEQGRTSTRRAFITSTLFSVGILITIGLVGVVTAWLGRIAGNLGGWANYLVAIIFFAVGLVLLDVVPLPFSGPWSVGIKRRGLLAAFILGLVFGVALGPCTFAYMAPMLAIIFRYTGTAVLWGVLLLLVYGIGHCAVIVLAGTSTELVQRYLDWNERSKGAVYLKRVCGALVLLAGLYLVYTAA